MNIIKLNDDEKCFYDKTYTIELLYGGVYEINSNYEGEAIDILIDYFCDNKDRFRGYFFTCEELAELSEDDIQSYVFGGNDCKYITFHYHEIRIQDITKWII